MCEPTTLLIASLALTAATGVAGHMGQQAQADAQTKYQETMGRAHNDAAKQNAQSAIREQGEQSAAERTTQLQEQAAASHEMQTLQAERLRAQGEAVASSQAAGTAFDMLLADYKRTEARKKDIIKQQLEMQGAAHDFTVSGFRDRTDSRLKGQSGFIASPVGQPSWALTGLGIAGGMVDKGLSFQTAKDKK